MPSPFSEKARLTAYGFRKGGLRRERYCHPEPVEGDSEESPVEGRHSALRLQHHTASSLRSRVKIKFLKKR